MPKGSSLLVEVGQGLALMVGLPTISQWSEDERPKKAKRGTFGYNADTNSLEYWDGTQWFASNKLRA